MTSHELKVIVSAIVLFDTHNTLQINETVYSNEKYTICAYSTYLSTCIYAYIDTDTYLRRYTHTCT